MSTAFVSRSLVLPIPLERGATAISLREVTVRIGDRAIVDGVDLTVRAGEVVALVGPNGAGKSTLLGVVAGDLFATGAIEIAGVPLADWRLGDLARRRAVLAQDNAVSFPFTVIDVVEMGRAPWQRTALDVEDDEAVLEAMADTDVTRFARRHFPSLSGGERARVSMARILAQRTGILLLDEPTAALDIRHQEAVLEVARSRAALGDAVVIVLHDLSLAAAYADRVALLDNGRLRAVGTPREVLTAATISEVYQHPVDVIDHPVSGELIVAPIRAPRTASAGS